MKSSALKILKHVKYSNNFNIRFQLQSFKVFNILKYQCIIAWKYYGIKNVMKILLRYIHCVIKQ